jgi:uncharacterized protein YneR
MLTRITAIAVALLILAPGLTYGQDTGFYDEGTELSTISVRVFQFTPRKNKYEENPGFSIGLSGNLSKDWGILATLDLVRLELSDKDYYDSEDDNIYICSATLNVLYLFGTGQSGIIRPYLGGGIGLSQAFIKGDTDDEKRGACLQGIGGLKIFLAKEISIDAECRCSIAEIVDPGIDYGGAYIGVGITLH